MSSSSSDSDSDDYEPVRKIKINIRPKGEIVGRSSADTAAIKASVEAWRPLGPPPHPSLSRRQSSISSISSMSLGGPNSVYGVTTINANNHGSALHTSPSCSSLVNEFNNRSSFSNFMSTTSRTSSPLTLSNFGDTVPIAIAIQESIELTVKDSFEPNAVEPVFKSRLMGNIKVAFPNSFVRGSFIRSNPALKLLMHSNDNIIRYYTSGLIKDLDLGTESVDPNNINNAFSQTFTAEENSFGRNGTLEKREETIVQENSFSENPVKDRAKSRSKAIEFNMAALTSHLKMLFDKSPSSRYYNVDVLRYLIAPLKSIQECPLQVCAYWKVEAQMVKLRIDFKHSIKSGFNLERLREIVFTVDLANFIPRSVEINSLSPNSISNLKMNNNNSNAANMNASTINFQSIPASIRPSTSLIDYDGFDSKHMDTALPRLSPPVPPPTNNFGTKFLAANSFDTQVTPRPHNFNLLDMGDNNTWTQNEGNFKTNDCNLQKDSILKDPTPPFITYEPQANWNSSIKQLTWKFDTLLPYHKSDGLGSLMAKLDFRNYPDVSLQSLQGGKPNPIDVKFLVADSTLSKVSLSVDSLGYKMSLLKKEIRSARYRSEPYVM